MKAATWTGSTGDAAAERDAQPFVQALTNLRTGLLALANSYPPVATDIKALVTAYAPAIGDLKSLGSLSAFDASSWVQQFESDASKTDAAIAIVRSDLGLPQKSS